MDDPFYGGELIANPGFEVDAELRMILDAIARETEAEKIHGRLRKLKPKPKESSGCYKLVFIFKTWAVKTAKYTGGEEGHMKLESDMWRRLTKLERRFFAEIVLVFPWGHIQRAVPPNKHRECVLDRDRYGSCGEMYPSFKKAKARFHLSDVAGYLRNHVHRADKKGKIYPVVYDYGYIDLPEGDK